MSLQNAIRNQEGHSVASSPITHDELNKISFYSLRFYDYKTNFL